MIQGAALGARARELVAAAEAKGQSLSVLAAMEQARAELTPA
jgi:hypothetical protein